MTVDGAIFIVVLVIALALFSYALVRRLRLIMVGRPEWRFDRPITRTAGLRRAGVRAEEALQGEGGPHPLLRLLGLHRHRVRDAPDPRRRHQARASSSPGADSYGFNMAKDILSLIVEAGLLVLVYIRYVYRKTPAGTERRGGDHPRADLLPDPLRVLLQRHRLGPRLLPGPGRRVRLGLARRPDRRWQRDRASTWPATSSGGST